MIISAIRVIVNLKVTQIATCGSLASTVSDSESDDDVFQLVRPNQARNQLPPQGGGVRFPLTLYLQKTSYYKHECNSSLTRMVHKTHAHERKHGTNAEC